MRPKRKTLNAENLVLMGVPKKFTKITFNDVNTYDNSGLKKIKDFLYTYCVDIEENQQLGKGIFFYGANGVGKTMFASLIACEAYRRYYSVRRVTFVEYIDKYTRMWGTKNTADKDDMEGEFYSYYKGVDFLILEEIGKEIDSKIAAPILEDLLRYREDNSLVTIMCTNISPKDVQTRYGESVYSLLQGNMIPVKIDVIDRRKEVFTSEA